MKRKNKFLCCLFLFLVGVSGAAVAQNQALYSYGTSGNEPQQFDLGAIEKITFSSDAIQIHLVGSSSPTNLLFANVKKLTFAAGTGMGIGSVPVNNGGVKLYWKDDYVFIESSAEITAVSVYNMQGSLLKRTVAATNTTSLQIPTQGYSAGVYIIQVTGATGTVTQKIIKY